MAFRLYGKRIALLFNKHPWTRIESAQNELYKDLPDSPGFGLKYNFINIAKSFIDLNVFYFDGLGEKTYSFNLNRKLVAPLQNMQEEYL